MTRRAAWWAWALASATALMACASSCGSSGSPDDPTAAIAQAAPSPSAAPVQRFVPGRAYFGRNGYVEFRAGDASIVVSAPHGGALEPAEIPNRRSGTTVTDVATEELARLLAFALQSRTGRQPSLVICRLKRIKLDVNREIAEGAQGNPYAEQAWIEYHRFLDAARATAAALHGHALVVDVHGHSHPKARVEAGYLLGVDDLDGTDAALDKSAAAQRSSIRTLAAASGLRFSEVLRGRASLGGLLERAGYPAVPAPGIPSPGLDPYFKGGHIARRHGSVDGGPASAIQIETPYLGVRDTPAARERFAAVLADSLVTYVSTHLRPGS